ncbi:hypothetical protein BCR33DRAFT_716434 [Rhizoclosmatium globosum]|uniref:Uncharacterized protein n=1 Tax=Rhizoclosmatium globosum TaxID=329046 RepID=A0A1Y2CDI9_9FUNG|nr:hypothetical protein BCR33DRAFT_716434 [Rhizoclosmatium globosum]|eukprot:ORY45092.1 hypothetical protein BCR33DRAFT_716434 [Rhizoclosmatium globosum]
MHHSSLHSPLHMVVYGILAGSITEISVHGILCIWLLPTARVTTSPNSITKSESNKLSPIFLLMLFFNTWGIIYMALNTWALFLTRDFCFPGQIVVNLASQVYYISFDVFLLYKTYALCPAKPRIRLSIGLVILHRFLWTLADLVSSRGIYNDATNACEYYQNPITGFGYNASDIICDLFCTYIAVSKNWSHLSRHSKNFSIVARIVVHENILRSVIVLLVNSFEAFVFIGINSKNVFLAWLAYLVQDYFYARCLNAEFLWIKLRRDRLTSTVGNVGVLVTDSLNRLKEADEERQSRQSQQNRSLMMSPAIVQRPSFASVSFMAPVVRSPSVLQSPAFSEDVGSGNYPGTAVRSLSIRSYDSAQ